MCKNKNMLYNSRRVAEWSKESKPFTMDEWQISSPKRAKPEQNHAQKR